MSSIAMNSPVSCSCYHGPGYKNPDDARLNGAREKVLFVTCVQPKQTGPDYLATVDVDPNSSTYGQVIHRTFMPNIGDEMHHSGWNICSSCFGDSTKSRNRMILPCLNSNRIYVVETSGGHDSNSSGDSDGASKMEATRLIKTIEGHQLEELDVSAPHTSHCLPTGKIMISCMGDGKGARRGSLLLLDGQTFEPLGLWSQQSVNFGYDFWYQPRLDVLVSSEWGTPLAFRKGFSLSDIDAEHYGSCIHFWQWSTGKLLKSIDLGKETGKEALMPLEVRFLHDPDATEGYVGCAFSSNVFRFYLDSRDNDWHVEEVISIPKKKVTGWSFSNEMSGLITDILLSLDDRFLYASAWAFGEVRQYNIEPPNRSNPPLISVVRLGGLLSDVYRVKAIEAPDQDKVLPEQIWHKIKDKPIRGGSQMLQLSLDGKRLYATNSLFSAWDKQFYPDMFENGSQLIKVVVDTENGGMQVDKNFLVDFGNEPNGPALAHEMRYPGGDCTSDIWI